MNEQKRRLLLGAMVATAAAAAPNVRQADAASCCLRLLDEDKDNCCDYQTNEISNWECTDYSDGSCISTYTCYGDSCESGWW